MKPIWFRQLVVYAGLGLLAVPIYFVDHWLFAPRGSGWIALDFREILFWSYLIWLALCTVVSSIVLSAFLGARKVGVQLTLMGLSIVLLLTGSFVYGKSAVLERKSTIPKRDGTSQGAPGCDRTEALGLFS